MNFSIKPKPFCEPDCLLLHLFPWGLTLEDQRGTAVFYHWLGEINDLSVVLCHVVILPHSDWLNSRWCHWLLFQVYLAAASWTPALSPFRNPSRTATRVSMATAQTPTSRRQKTSHPRWESTTATRSHTLAHLLRPPSLLCLHSLRPRPPRHTQSPLIGWALWRHWAPPG